MLVETRQLLREVSLGLIGPSKCGAFPMPYQKRHDHFRIGRYSYRDRDRVINYGRPHQIIAVRLLKNCYAAGQRRSVLFNDAAESSGGSVNKRRLMRP